MAQEEGDQGPKGPRISMFQQLPAGPDSGQPGQEGKPGGATQAYSSADRPSNVLLTFNDSILKEPLPGILILN